MYCICVYINIPGILIIAYIPCYIAADTDIF